MIKNKHNFVLVLSVIGTLFVVYCEFKISVIFRGPGFPALGGFVDYLAPPIGAGSDFDMYFFLVVPSLLFLWLVSVVYKWYKNRNDKIKILKLAYINTLILCLAILLFWLFLKLHYLFF